MPDPVSVETIRDAAAALNNRGLATLEDLRLWINKDVDKSLPRLAESAGTAESLLIAFVIAEFIDDTGRTGRQKLGPYWRGLKPFFAFVTLYRIALGQAWKQKKSLGLAKFGEACWYIPRQLLTRHWRLWYNWRRHWADGLLIIVVPALLIGLWFRVQSAKNHQIQAVVVKPSAKVAAFQRIYDEVDFARLDNMGTGFTSLAEVRGRYSLVPLSGGTPVLSDQLLSTELSNKLQSRSIVSVPLKAGSYVRDLSPPSEAVLVVTPREEETISKQHTFEVILLAIDKNGDAVTATVALSAEDVAKAALLLGSSDAYLLKSAR